MNDKWQRIGALIVALGLGVALWIFRSRLGTDFWPLDRSTVGPNLVASLVTWGAVLVATALLYPPLRRRIKGWAEGHFTKLHARIARDHREAREHRQWEAQHLAELYEKHMGKPARPHPHFSLTRSQSRD